MVALTDWRDIFQAEFDDTLEAKRITGGAGIVKFDPDDSKPTYIGINKDADALDTASDWEVFEFTYSGDNITKIRKKTGSWTGRGSLF
jgi:hypothetical protein